MGPLIHIPEACGNWIWWPQRQGKHMQLGNEVYSMIFSTFHTHRQRFQLPVTEICPSHSSGNITAMSSSMDAAPRFLFGMMLISWFRLKATWIIMVMPSGFNWFWNMCACNLFSLQKNNHPYQHAVVKKWQASITMFCFWSEKASDETLIRPSEDEFQGSCAEVFNCFRFEVCRPLQVQTGCRHRPDEWWLVKMNLLKIDVTLFDHCATEGTPCWMSDHSEQWTAGIGLNLSSRIHLAGRRMWSGSVWDTLQSFALVDVPKQSRHALAKTIKNKCVKLEVVYTYNHQIRKYIFKHTRGINALIAMWSGLPRTGWAQPQTWNNASISQCESTSKSTFVSPLDSIISHAFRSVSGPQRLPFSFFAMLLHWATQV